MTTISENATAFCRAVETRSREHREAVETALDKGWLAIAACVLRMELDSLIRVKWLCRHPDTRGQILASCVAGKGFKAGGKRIPDVELVKEAVSDGWERAVYDFGNAFVHLTNMHDYAALDPFQAYEHRGEVIRYLNAYHRGKVPGGPLDDSSTLTDLGAYAPHVLEKITSNMDYSMGYLREHCI
jgi:hypothetical protein